MLSLVLSFKICFVLYYFGFCCCYRQWFCLFFIFLCFILLLLVFVWFCFLETGSHHVALELALKLLTVLLPLPSYCWDCRCPLPHLTLHGLYEFLLTKYSNAKFVKIWTSGFSSKAEFPRGASSWNKVPECRAFSISHSQSTEGLFAVYLV